MKNTIIGITIINMNNNNNNNTIITNNIISFDKNIVLMM